MLSRGISLSSDLINACSHRGIKIFFNTFNSFSALHTLYEHKSVTIRKNQFEVCENNNGLELARQLIIGKLKNQRATLLYSTRTINNDLKNQTIEAFDILISKLKNKKELSRDYIMGIEGKCASIYFEFLKKSCLFPPSFTTRTKRNSQEITNIALNYGYTILFNFIYKSIINSGLEPYYGVLHSIRSAKPSLVLDIMEEYRSFVVDRNIIKLRSRLANTKEFDKIKKNIATNILNTLSKKYKYNHKKLTLESIIQRQIYKISGYICEQNKYKSYIFRW
ncbi:MAG: CRISPR-associated protein Cas1 [uncultured Campylobacterales bacterium]|uniref:CRISPR-associated endonuclease Cas1 n=1 Tax=uncultured Campylobacterales bacterium TaxID=352960 RepID=A0A6S6T488_9BACT|nr:MAG: CRISPR-associated protein Cas1 [uncultured Campylobacterales bacterium]